MSSPDEDKKAVPSNAYDKAWIEDAWGDSGESFKNLKGLEFRPRVKKALDLGDVKEGMRILDIGCGRGEVVFYALQKNVDQVVGVDYSKDTISLALETLKKYPADQQKRAQFVQADVKELNFSEKSFDRIFLLDIVEHLHDWELDIMFGKLRQLLKDDGYLVIHTLPNKWVYDNGYKFVRFFYRKLPKDPRGEREKIFHVNEQTLLHLAAILKRNNYYYKINLEQFLPEQAAWYRNHIFGDRRDVLYKIIRHPIITFLLRVISMTPLKLIVSNDIFAVAYKDKQVGRPFKQNLIEKLFMRQ